MKYCNDCQQMVEDSLVEKHGEFSYHWAFIFFGSLGDPNIVGCHAEEERTLCGPIRELTLSEKSTLDELEKLENLLGVKL